MFFFEYRMPVVKIFNENVWKGLLNRKKRDSFFNDDEDITATGEDASATYYPKPYCDIVEGK